MALRDDCTKADPTERPTFPVIVDKFRQAHIECDEQEEDEEEEEGVCLCHAERENEKERKCGGSGLSECTILKAAKLPPHSSTYPRSCCRILSPLTTKKSFYLQGQQDCLLQRSLQGPQGTCSMICNSVFSVSWGGKGKKDSISSWATQNERPKL
eukprot:m.135202 g.135202  ORF g.135202 m.135202 type:complete len:155 (-) comp23900_c0_seq2:79-543(-)